MTREQCQSLLPIMQAFAEGKEIECKGRNNLWVLTVHPDFESDREFRIKPEPEVLEMWAKPGRETMGLYRAALDDTGMIALGWTKKKFREVTE